MNIERPIDTIDGLFAYYLGFTDSGIHDEALERSVKEELSNMTRHEFETCVELCIRHMELVSDASEFKAWISQDLIVRKNEDNI